MLNIAEKLSTPLSGLEVSHHPQFTIPNSNIIQTTLPVLINLSCQRHRERERETEREGERGRGGEGEGEREREREKEEREREGGRPSGCLEASFFD